MRLSRAPHRVRRRTSPPNGRWRVPELVDEAWRRTSTAWVVRSLIVTCLATVVALAAVHDEHAAVDAQADREAAGASIFVASVPDGQTLDAGRCAALVTNQAVASAGPSFGEVVDVPVTWEPAHLTTPAYDLSLGALRTWWPEAPATGGVFLGQDLASAAGTPIGADLRFGDQPTRVMASLPSAVRPAQLQASVVRVVPAAGRATECWIRMKPGSGGAAASLVTAALPDSQLVTVPFVRPDDLSVEPGELLSGSALRFAWLAALAIVVMVGAIATVVERPELGIYLTTGTRRRELLLMGQVQDVVAATSAWAVAVSVGLAASARVGLPFDARGVWFFVQPTTLFCASVVVLAPLVQQLLSVGARTDTMRAT